MGTLFLWFNNGERVDVLLSIIMTFFYMFASDRKLQIQSTKKGSWCEKLTYLKLRNSNGMSWDKR